MTKGRILLIGRSDCLGEKGVQAGIWTAGVHGLAASTVIMNLTARDEGRNFDETELPGTFIVRQAEAILESQKIDVVKVGRLSSEEQIEATAQILDDSRLAGCPVLITPAFFRANDEPALGVRAIAHWKRRLAHRARMVVVTEREADALGGFQAEGREELPHVAETLATLGSETVLLSAQDPGGDGGLDIFLDAEGVLYQREFPVLRDGEAGLDTPNFSTAMACQLALGHESREAARRARDFIVAEQNESAVLTDFARIHGG